MFQQAKVIGHDNRIYPFKMDAMNHHSSRTKLEPRCIVSGAHALVLRLSSYVGIAPLKFEPSVGGGWIISISKPMCFYSYGLILILLSATFWGLSDEIFEGVDNSVRMKSYLSQVVSSCDIGVVALAASTGVFCAPGRFRNLMKIMDRVSELDIKLGLEYSSVAERKPGALCTVVLLSFITLLIDDFFIYANQARFANKEWILVSHYFGFYMLYVIAITLEIQFVFTAYAIRSRFRLLNDIMLYSSKCINHPDKEYTTRSPICMYAIRTTSSYNNSTSTSNNIKNNINLLIDTMTLYPDDSHIITKSNRGRKLSVSVTEAIKRLTIIHNQLYRIIQDLERGYSLPILTILASCLLQLIVTPYFLIFEIIATSHRSHYLVLQFCWTFAHSTRLYGVVEPCHLIIAEGKRTQQILSELMGLCERNDGGLNDALDLFFKQLMLKPVTVSPFGICTLDRSLIATIIGAVTTYLVILIQFQKSDL